MAPIRQNAMTSPLDPGYGPNKTKYNASPLDPGYGPIRQNTMTSPLDPGYGPNKTNAMTNPAWIKKHLKAVCILKKYLDAR